MSNPRLPISSASKRKCDNDPRNGKDSPQRNKIAKTTEAAFDDVGSMNAREYLSRVNREAKKIPDIMVAEEPEPKTHRKEANPTDDASFGREKKQSPARGDFVPIDGSAASLAYLLSRRSSTTPLPSRDHLPKTDDVKGWATSAIANFERLRGYLEASKAQGFGGKQTARKPVPAMKDRVSWHVFCVGFDDASGNSGAYFADDYSDDDDDNDNFKSD
mmetsp:Transcript_4151/g.10774  ORF Transcript_4151/g.10774 Transcript_4151/m.10774 type:complete len:217 (-) Transcript_4151:3034-3684(-)